MAEEIDIEEMEEGLEESTIDQDTENEEAQEEDEENADPKKGSPKKPLPKWVFLTASIAVILLIIVLGFVFGSKFFNKKTTKKRTAQEELNILQTIKQDNLSEEILYPLYISSSKNVIRIDLSIVSDGITFARLKEKELFVRDSMYNRISEMAKDYKDLNEHILLIEDEIRNIILSNIKTNSLFIRVKEISYY